MTIKPQCSTTVAYFDCVVFRTLYYDRSVFGLWCFKYFAPRPLYNTTIGYLDCVALRISHQESVYADRRVFRLLYI